jgi:hypothetical protein
MVKYLQYRKYRANKAIYSIVEYRSIYNIKTQTQQTIFPNIIIGVLYDSGELLPMQMNELMEFHQYIINDVFSISIQIFNSI